ncbi:PTS sugar transporter subunit IIA [Enterococcus mediterraneensis]|uniref:PTS sugar transporter subunit IIA n=1 Tax=Enterococcus mediterraneensis TaxID=2364791 RepID=UPI000F05493A|nr:PTS sugar transporter subunit IIA [Enterococcus mediterraneensis]
MKVIVTSHGDFCHGILKSYQMIAGESENFYAVSLTEEGVKDYSDRLNKVLTELESEEILILTDIKGGTPYNESYQYYLTHEERVRVVAGMNLPMIIEVGINLFNDNLEILYNKALQAGLLGIEGADNGSMIENDLEF